MGKNLIQQARGKGSPTYRAPSFRYKGEAKHRPLDEKTITGEIRDFVQCQGHSAPLAEIRYEDGEKCLLMAPEGAKVGDVIESGKDAAVEVGNTVQLRNLSEGTVIYNIESNPGDGGKFVRASGTFARVTARMKDKIIVELPSKKERAFDPDCRACIGVVAGGGRLEKPLLKAGNMYFKKKAKNKLWPNVSGTAMNAVDHPFGGSRTSKKGRPTIAPRNAPPGRKVGMIRPRKTGRVKMEQVMKEKK